MTTKLTLTMEDKVIDAARRYAQMQGRSLSNLVENYLKSIASELNSSDGTNISAKVLKLMGIIKLPEDFEYKTELGNALAKKYSK